MHLLRAVRAFKAVSTWFLLLFAFVSLTNGPPSAALSPNRRLSQYGHTAWRIQDGYFSGAPNAIAQTGDGYIWIGTQAGLIRFDGARFVPFRPSAGEPLRSPVIDSLLAASDGSLWIGTKSYLTHLKDGRLTGYLDNRGQISAIRQGRNGTIWISRQKPNDPNGALCRVDDIKLHCYGESGGMPFQYAVPLVEGAEGGWWIASPDQLAHWRDGSSTLYSPPGLKPARDLAGFTSLALVPDGSIWAGLMQPGRGLGLQHLVQGRWMPFATAGFDSSSLSVNALFLDSDHTLWVGTINEGVYRIHGSMVDHFGAADGLSGDWVNDFFEDHEGNVWVATTKGMDKFRETRVVSFSRSEGLSADLTNSLLAARDGTIWIGNLGALDSIRGEKVTSIDSRGGLPGHEVTSLAEGRSGRLWVGVDDKLFTYSPGIFKQVRNDRGGATGTVENMSSDIDGTIWAAPITETHKLMHIENDRVAEEISVPSGLRIRSLATDPNGGVWAGLSNGDIAQYTKGNWKVIALHRAVNTGTVIGLTVSQDEKVLGATSLGVLEWKDGRSQTLGTENGLPCKRIYSLIQDSKQMLWLYSECGLVSIADSELRRWWQHPDAKLHVQVFDTLDGAQPMDPDFEPSTSMTPDGKLWFANSTIVQEVDPLHLFKNIVVPPVHIEEFIADEKNYPVQKDLHLPALTRNLEIDYTALSFVIPQRVRFRYRLEGLQNDWQDADTRRQAFYTDLPPGPYRFHVIACNDDGLWNEVGDELAFTIAPAYYQTKWFEFLCVLSFAGMLWVFYLYRLRRATGQVQERLGARLEERERIARELHDTLLQGFQGLMLRFQSVMKILPDEGPAHQMMEDALDRADEILLEGRQSVRDLREKGNSEGELSETLANLGKELAHERAALFSIAVVGTAQALDPTVFNEICRIGREALINAFQHAKASKIQVKLTYDSARFVLSVLDDGVGIDSEVLSTGRLGHWGLSGMRERAYKIGAQLHIWSKPNAGTEIELTIPATLAWPQQHNESLWMQIKRAVVNKKDA